MAENIHLLTKEIRASSDKTLFEGHYSGRLTSLLSVFSSDSTYFKNAVREYNKKLREFNLSSEIVQPVDGGLRPLNTNFFGTLLQARNQGNVGNSSTNVQQIWDSNLRGAQIIKRGMPGSNRTIRLFSQDGAEAVSNGMDLDSLANYPAKFRVSFNITQNSAGAEGTADIDTTNFTHSRTPPVTNKGIYLSDKDDDAVDETPNYLNKNFFAIKKGFNSFDVELFDDGDEMMPTIDIVMNKNGIFDLDIKNIEIRFISN